MFIIGICGGSASGKTFICNQLYKLLIKTHKTQIIHQDDFYNDIPNDVTLENYDFDCPEALNLNKFKDTICSLKNENSVQVPIYNHTIHKSIGTRMIDQCDILLVEGIFVFVDDELRKLYDLTIYVDASSEVRFSRRIYRDISNERKLNEIITRYLKFIKPAYDKYIHPTKISANIVIINDESDAINFEYIISIISDKLKN